MSGGGRFEFDDGGYYVGDWNNGTAHGYGVCTGPQCRGKFEGFWQEGTEVIGVYNWPDGTSFRGEWKNGHRSGSGQEKTKSFTYSGEWLNGLKHGSGINETGPQNRVCYEGTWKNGLQDGHGVEIYKNGGFYAGQWKDGQRHGFGIRADADIDQLTEGSASVRLLLNETPAVLPRPSTFCAPDGTSVLDCLPADIMEEEPRTPPISSSEDSSRSSLEQLKSGRKKRGILRPSLTLAIPMKEDVMSSNSTSNNNTSSHNSKTREIYKGAWSKDQRSGYGICFYEDGSRYVGHWKDNKRNGYGFFISKDGKKTGGKWFNDSLMLLNRLRNLKMSLIRRKTNDTVNAAIDAASRASMKTRLALTRGIAAKQVADTCKEVAERAVENAKIAREVQRKYTLHPEFEASLTQYTSNQQQQQQEQQLTTENHSPAFKRNNSLRQPSPIHNREAMVNRDRERIQKSVLFTALDISLTACAMSPCLSQTILLNHADEFEEPRRDSMVSENKESTSANKNAMFTNGLSRSNSRKSTHSEHIPMTMTSNSLHAPDMRTNFLNSTSVSMDSNTTTSSTEEAKLVRMRARMLSGEDVSYQYIAVNMNVNGKETQVLHTEHPRPKFQKGYSISEKDRLNSSTGIYRTVVGEVPSVLSIEADPNSRPSSLYDNKDDPIFSNSMHEPGRKESIVRCSAPEKLDLLDSPPPLFEQDKQFVFNAPEAKSIGTQSSFAEKSKDTVDQGKTLTFRETVEDMEVKTKLKKQINDDKGGKPDIENFKKPCTENCDSQNCSDNNNNDTSLTETNSGMDLTKVESESLDNRNNKIENNNSDTSGSVNPPEKTPTSRRVTVSSAEMPKIRHKSFSELDPQPFVRSTVVRRSAPARKSGNVVWSYRSSGKFSMPEKRKSVKIVLRSGSQQQISVKATKDTSSQTSFDEEKEPQKELLATQWLQKNSASWDDRKNSFRSISTDSGYKRSLSIDESTSPRPFPFSPYRSAKDVRPCSMVEVKENTSSCDSLIDCKKNGSPINAKDTHSSCDSLVLGEKVQNLKQSPLLDEPEVKTPPKVSSKPKRRENSWKEQKQPLQQYEKARVMKSPSAPPPSNSETYTSAVTIQPKTRRALSSTSFDVPKSTAAKKDIWPPTNDKVSKNNQNKSSKTSSRQRAPKLEQKSSTFDETRNLFEEKYAESVSKLKIVRNNAR